MSTAIRLPPTARRTALQLARRLAASSALLLFAQQALPADEPPLPPAPPQEQVRPATRPRQACTDCGTVRSIREIRTERLNARPDIYVTSPQYLDTRPYDPPVIGPALSLTWRKGEQPQPRIGAIGSPNDPVRFIDITYEVLVHFEDARFALIEQDDASNLRVGDRVRVINRRVEPARD